MAHRPNIIHQQDDKVVKKSVIVIPSRIVSRPDDVEGGEETEIAALIALPEEGGWGWVVVIAAFLSIFILDGVTFTFGSILPDMAEDLQTMGSLIALLNSIAVAIYQLAGPIASAMINRFGFRACSMAGSVICSFSLFSSYFASSYGSLCFFYGFCSGFGFALVNMSAGLVVGFYFERLRGIALSITTCGSSLGITSFYPLNTFLVKLAGWRTLMLLHSGLMGMIFFFGMTFRPLLSLTVTQATDDPTRTVTYLPNLSKAGMEMTVSQPESLKPTGTEKLFSAISNVNFPTAAAVIEDNAVVAPQPGPSTLPAVSKLKLTALNPTNTISRRQLKQVKSIVSSAQAKNKNIETDIQIEGRKSRRCLDRLCQWERHIEESRPMYRDDVFYEGKLEQLQIYKKSVMEIPNEEKTGIEYQLAVTRAATTRDLQEKRGIFTTSVRRVLATMLDPLLLKKNSFLFLCGSGFLVYLGILVPYVFIEDKNLQAGVDPKHCTLFVSAIGLSNACGRLVLGSLASKMSPLKLLICTSSCAGICTILSNLSHHIYFQYAYCCVFGFCVASFASVRSMAIVSLYGLDKLTNAMGIILLFQGLGSLISTPMASVFKESFGYTVAFCVSGSFLTAGGILLIPISALAKREIKTNTPRISVQVEKKTEPKKKSTTKK